ncbi:MAG: oxygen-dependent coproporphyrinogen oxidase, partial [Bacteroidota bacterium]
VFREGTLIEKGGVNFSHVHGPMPDVISKKLKLPQGAHFDATGVSIVLHPRHPLVPIFHMIVRYFEMENGRYWFGGGIDVTPAYIDRAQAVKFHQRMKDTCDASDPEFYPRFKAWCDRYFFLSHRDETRGIGGLFFDHLHGETPEEKAHYWKFVQSVGQSFVPAYTDLAEANRHKPYGEREQGWQLLRRARYVEFNLVHDRGTKFGLDTGGRTESILMSMPPLAAWEYDHRPEPNSPEAETLSLLRPIDWLA